MEETGLRASFAKQGGEWLVRFLNPYPMAPRLEDAALDLAIFVLANPGSVGSLARLHGKQLEAIS